MESDDTIEKAVIVGGGLAGLTAAYELKRAGIAARIFDKDDKIGQTWLDRHPQLSLNTHRSVSHRRAWSTPVERRPFHEGQT